MPHADGAPDASLEAATARAERHQKTWRAITAPGRGPVLDGLTRVIIDNDTRFADHFRATLGDDGTECVRIPPQAPDSVAERFVGRARREILDRWIFLSIGSLTRALGEFVDHHYLRERNHQGIGNELEAELRDGAAEGLVRRRHRLGGLLKYSHRGAGAPG